MTSFPLFEESGPPVDPEALLAAFWGDEERTIRTLAQARPDHIARMLSPEVAGMLVQAARLPATVVRYRRDPSTRNHLLQVRSALEARAREAEPVRPSRFVVPEGLRWPAVSVAAVRSVWSGRGLPQVVWFDGERIRRDALVQRLERVGADVALSTCWVVRAHLGAVTEGLERRLIGAFRIALEQLGREDRLTGRWAAVTPSTLDRLRYVPRDVRSAVAVLGRGPLPDGWEVLTEPRFGARTTLVRC